MNQPFYLTRWLLSRQAVVIVTVLLSCAVLYAIYDLRTVDGQQVKPQWLSLGSWPTPYENEETSKIQPVGIVYTPTSMKELTTAVGLAGVKVVALVFFGRRDLVSILDCYLKVTRDVPSRLPVHTYQMQRNLKANGGLLDEVIFTVNTDNNGDLAYLEELLKSSPYYRKFVKSVEHEGWAGQWQAVNETDTIYVKIDDDVVHLPMDIVVGPLWLVGLRDFRFSSKTTPSPRWSNDCTTTLNTLQYLQMSSTIHAFLGFTTAWESTNRTGQR